jgi:N-acetyl-anhydromuramyl-L-alanine amidase AmpD
MNTISVPSPNFSPARRGYHPEAVVIHIMEGTLLGTDNWFKNPQSKVSAHFGVGTNGEVHQYVPEADTAWHAGRVHAPSWNGIKPTGDGLYVNPNYYTIGIEHEGNERSEWTDAMYDATSELIVDISRRWNIPLDRSHIIGHHEIYSIKTCPGSKVDLQKLVDMCKEKAGYAAPSEIVKVPGGAVTTTALNLRRGAPSTKAPLVQTVDKGTTLNYTGYIENGERIKKVARWYQTAEGFWFWGGGVKTSKTS